MRGKDEQQLRVFSYISPEQRVPQDHPLRSLRAMTDEALRLRQPVDAVKASLSHEITKLHETLERP